MQINGTIHFTADELRRIGDAIDYIKKKYPRHVSSEELSEEVQLNSRTLQAGFRERTGLTIHHYQLQKRIDKAMADLQNVELSLKAITHQNGFKNTSQFGKAFKKITGKTPMEYRLQFLN